MHRIDTKTAQKDKFGAGKNGFTRGNPRPARLPPIWMMTTLTCCRKSSAAWWRASGASAKARHDQLLTTRRALLLKPQELGLRRISNPDGTVKTALKTFALGETGKTKC